MTTRSKTALILPLLMMGLLVSISVTGVSGAATTLLSSIPGNEMSCMVKKMEAVAGSANEFLVHTDGCSDTRLQTKTFSMMFDEEMKDNFIELGFQHGIPAGTTLNIDYSGVKHQGMGLLPRITRLSEDPMNMMPY